MDHRVPPDLSSGRALQSRLWYTRSSLDTDRERERLKTQEILQRVLYWLDERPRNTYGLLRSYDAIFGQQVLSKRHDSYDNAIASMFYLMMGRKSDSSKILDAFLKVGGTVDFGSDDDPEVDKDVSRTKHASQREFTPRCSLRWPSCQQHSTQRDRP